jgi:hypothetical protein
MLRLFSDCLELSDPSSDGWTVITGLHNAYYKEKVPVSERSIIWLLRLTSMEKIVACGAKSIWGSLQHAVRAFLVHERDNQVLQKLLALDQDGKKRISASHATAIAQWLALRASQREVLPIIVEAGRILHMDGFDWIDDNMTPNQFVRALPVLYAAWTRAYPDGIAKVEELIALELDEILDKAVWTRKSLLQSISCSENENKSRSHDDSRRCSTCGDNYGSLGVGVVAPRWIAFMECTKTSHKFKCDCSELLQRIGAMETLVNSNESFHDGCSDFDEEVFRENYENISELCKKYTQMHIGDQSTDPFRDAATLLYRAQGRRWLGLYEPVDLLCATCFLRREGYIGERGLGTEHVWTPMPESYGVFCTKNIISATI